MRKYIYVVVALLLVTSACKESPNQSPNKAVEATVYVDEDNMLVYDVSFNGKEIISKSNLGIIVDNDSLGNNVKLELQHTKTINERYQTRGFHNEAINLCQQYTYRVTSSEKTYFLQTRVYNDGFAFRYLIPGTGVQHVHSELSSFAVPKNTNVWFFERPNHWKLKTYAGEWLRTTSDSLYCISPNGPVQGTALVYELSNPTGYMAIAEAALYNYSGMRLEAHADASLHVNFTEKEGFDVEGDIQTPWRVIMLTNNLNDLVNSDLITNLNPAPDTTLFADQSWIKPGRSIWSWWSEPKDYMTLESEKNFIDKASNLGFEYTTLDEGWEKWTDKWATLSDVCQYAAKRNVGVFVWKHSSQLNIPTDDYAAMGLFFDSLQYVGVKGVKTDFMDGESKTIIDFDIRALQIAAERKLMVNFHGCQSPSGEFRTYPNEITREGIRGLELNKMNQPIPAKHNVALIFTRCILNNNDYTPIGFSRPANTTWTHQLATGYAFTSPLITLAEHPDMLYNNEEIRKVLPFIKEMPSTWDETKILEGSSINGVAIMARRKDNTWYLVVLNGEGKRSLNVRLSSFLSEGKWKMVSVEDVESEPRKMNVLQQEIAANKILQIELSAEGGYLGKFIK